MVNINGTEYTDREFTKKVAEILIRTYETILSKNKIYQNIENKNILGERREVIEEAAMCETVALTADNPYIKRYLTGIVTGTGPNMDTNVLGYNYTYILESFRDVINNGVLETEQRNLQNAKDNMKYKISTIITNETHSQTSNYGDYLDLE